MATTSSGSTAVSFFTVCKERQAMARPLRSAFRSATSQDGPSIRDNPEHSFDTRLALLRKFAQAADKAEQNQIFEELVKLDRRLIYRLMYVMHDRLKKLGILLEADDLYTDALLAYYKAVSLFDEAREAKLSTFFTCTALTQTRNVVAEYRYHGSGLAAVPRKTKLTRAEQDDSTFKNIAAIESDDEVPTYPDSSTTEVLNKAVRLGVIDDRHRQLLIARYGLDGSTKTLQEIANSRGVTRQCIGAIADSVIQRLRAAKEKFLEE